jgi:hypothetical protein
VNSTTSVNSSFMNLSNYSNNYNIKIKGAHRNMAFESIFSKPVTKGLLP